MRQVILPLLAGFISVKGFLPATTRRANPTSLKIIPDSFSDDIPEHLPGVHRNTPAEEKKVKFVTGDELHKLRREVMAMRLELQVARRNGSKLLVRALEKAIMNAQKVDAEFIYKVSMERREFAEEKGLFQEAEKYMQQAIEARSALPQFNLEGLWVGKYSEHGYEMINVTYDGDMLVAQKVTGTKNVPKGEVSFTCDLSPKAGVTYQDEEALEPIKLGDGAAKQWGSKYLQRFLGKGQVAAEGYQDHTWIDGQLIMVNDYFSFAWIPIGHQVFFGRPTPELILKLLKDEKQKETGKCSARALLERCWTETQHLEDDVEVSHDGPLNHMNEPDYYHQEGCFE